MPRKEEQNKQTRVSRKEQIIQAALVVFARRGMTAAKISDIAKEAGFSHGLVYHYFKSKEEIFTTLVKRASERSMEIIDQAVQHKGSPLAQIHWMTKKIFNSIDKEEASLLFLIMIQATTSEAVPDGVRVILAGEDAKSPVTALLPLIVSGQQTGEIVDTDPLTLAITYYAIIQGLAINKIQWKDCPIPDAELALKVFK